jgi:hypothetical protein
MADSFLTLIVTADHVDLARNLAASFGPGGAGMWTTPLSASGAEPASHYVSSGMLPAEFADMVPTQTWELVDGLWTMTSSTPGNAAAVYYVAQQQGVECTLEEVTDTLATSDVTEQPPFTAFARLGLQIVNPPEEG